MAYLIDKDALVAEIERIYNEGYKSLPSDIAENIQDFKDDVLINIDTLEEKEVDLEIEQRMKECPYRQVGCTMYEGHILECRGACGWVVDYLNLKKLKVQKENRYDRQSTENP